MKTKSPAFQFYPNEWLGSTKVMLMTPEEEGAYIRLLCIAWNDPTCSLPDDDDQLAVLSRLNERWFKGGSTKVRACFRKRGNRLYNDRLLAERKKQKEWREKSRAGGIASANARKNKAKRSKGGSRVVQPTGQPKPNSSSSSSVFIPRNIDTPDFREAWKDWEQYRKEIKKKLTPSTMKSQLKTLAKWGETKAIMAIRKSIDSGWTGLFEPDCKSEETDQGIIEYAKQWNKACSMGEAGDGEKQRIKRNVRDNYGPNGWERVQEVVKKLNAGG